MTILTWWERAELEDHLLHRPDIWSWMESRSLWIRTDTNSEPQCALGFQSDGRTGPYRCSAARIVPLAWTAEQCETYLRELCIKWTAYGTRTQTIDLCIAELGISADKALALAIAIGQIEHDYIPDPEKEERPAADHWQQDANPLAHVTRSFPIIGGGWVRLSSHGGMLRAEISVRGHHWERLQGFVRPDNGNITFALQNLFTTETVPDLRGDKQ